MLCVWLCSPTEGDSLSELDLRFSIFARLLPTNATTAAYGYVASFTKTTLIQCRLVRVSKDFLKSKLAASQPDSQACHLAGTKINSKEQHIVFFACLLVCLIHSAAYPQRKWKKFRAECCDFTEKFALLDFDRKRKWTWCPFPFLTTCSSGISSTISCYVKRLHYPLLRRRRWRRRRHSWRRRLRFRFRG